MFKKIVIIICFCFSLSFADKSMYHNYEPVNYKRHSFLVNPHFNTSYVQDLTKDNKYNNYYKGALWGESNYKFSMLRDDIYFSLITNGYLYTELPNVWENEEFGEHKYRKEQRHLARVTIGGSGNYYFWGDFKVGGAFVIDGEVRAESEKYHNKSAFSENKTNISWEFEGNDKKRIYSVPFTFDIYSGFGRTNLIEEIIVAHEIIELLGKNSKMSMSPTLLAQKIGELKNKPIHLDSTENRVTLIDDLVTYLEKNKIIVSDSLLPRFTLEILDLLEYNHFKRKNGYEIKFTMNISKVYDRAFTEMEGKSIAFKNGISQRYSYFENNSAHPDKIINEFNEELRVKKNIDTLLYGIECNWYIPLTYKRQLNFSLLGKIGNGLAVIRAFKNEIMEEKVETLFRQGMVYGSISYSYYPTLMKKYYSNFFVNYKRDWQFEELVNNIPTDKTFPKRIRHWEFSWMSGVEYLISSKVKYKIYGGIRYNNPKPIVTEYDGKKPFTISLGSNITWYIH